MRSLAYRFLSQVDRSGGPDACWPWTGLRDKDGYGRFFIGDGEVRANRLALEIRLGRPLTDAEKTLHSCDYPPCCNGRHLSPGTTADNNADCAAKGRNAHGERNGAAKLTTGQARTIIRLAAKGAAPGVFTRLARRFGVSSRMVSYIASGQRWAHLRQGSQP